MLKRDAEFKFKFKNQDIYISDHLSPLNRHLFTNATAKRELGYKFLRNRNGSIFIRKEEHSPILKIINDECLGS